MAVKRKIDRSVVKRESINKDEDKDSIKYTPQYTSKYKIFNQSINQSIPPKFDDSLAIGLIKDLEERAQFRADCMAKLPEKLISDFIVVMQLIPVQWFDRHVQILRTIGQERYIELAQHALKYGRPPARLFTYLVNKEMRKEGQHG